MNLMLNGIYVGKPKRSVNKYSERLGYGMTGYYSEEPHGEAVFVADGCKTIWIISQDDIYIPSEHQTRHCPKV